MHGEASADLVLVGGGHAHVQVVRRFMMAPLSEVRLTLVLDRPDAVYSGMVPGLVAGDYAPHELEIDAVPLARRAGARVILSKALGVDPVARRIRLEGRPDVAYDVASLDVGSTVRGLDLPGVAEHALATRPIRQFVDTLVARLEGLRGIAEPRIAVVGAGAAGSELAFTLQARARSMGLAPRIVVVGSDPRLLAGLAPRVGARLEREARRRGIELRLASTVRAVSKRGVLLEDGEEDAHLVVWATGAAPVALPATEALPTDERGFVSVRPTLQVEGHDDLFAVGDCASLAWAPWVGKAGVYAVREGPVLDANLRARLRGRPLRSYRPQRDFLTLLNLGGGEALGTKWGFSACGAWVHRLKDRIDRAFMRRFQVLDADGALAPDFPTPQAMGMEEMACGGCAAKVGQSPLGRALARLPEAPPDASVVSGLDLPDDAAALALPGGDVVLATIDAFRAFTDDPWLVGRAAAVNAVSDVLAKGGTARHALALVNVPESDAGRAEETLFQVLSGVRAALDPLGVTLVGGHTTQGEDLFVGLSVMGTPDGEGVLPLAGARPGDALLLSKPLGSGVLLAADMQGTAPGRDVAALHAELLRSNATAARVAREQRATACTDVSGFGLAGHLSELLRAGGVAAELSLAAIPAYAGVVPLLERGVRSTYHEQNAAGRRGIGVARELAGDPRLELLFDPQTCGGLLMTVDAARVEAAVDALRAGGDVAAERIGRVTPARADGALLQVGA
ncbi:MAG: selenide, water dikinase SelD [Myxococcota bacterium]